MNMNAFSRHRRIATFAMFFLFSLVVSQNIFASSRVDTIFAMVENKAVSASTIKKELAKSSTLYTATKGDEKETLLMVALKNDRSLDVVTVLLNAGVDPEKKSKLKKTALMYACQYSTNVAVVEKVLKTQAWFDISKRHRILAKDKLKLTSFDYADLNENEAEREKIINLLLRYAKRPEKKTAEKEEPPLEDEIEIAEPPVEQNAEVENTPQEEAAVVAAVEPVAEKEEPSEEIEEETAEEPETEIAESPAEDEQPQIQPPVEIEEEERNIISDVNARDEFGRTKLMMAAGDGNVELVKDLLYSGAIVDICDNEGCTALMYGVRHQSNPEILKILLDHNANFRTTSESGMSALMYAASENQTFDFVKILIGNRLASETDLQAAFIKAVESEDSEDILNEFVGHGISVDIKVNGKTPLMYAAETNKKTATIKWLLKQGASKTTRTIDGKCAADFASENPNIPHDKVYKALSKF